MNSPIYPTSLFDLLLLGILFTGLTISFLLWFRKDPAEPADRFIALALFFTNLWLFLNLLADLHLANDRAGWYLLCCELSLLSGPLLYGYVLSLVRPGYRWGRRDLWHLWPLPAGLALQRVEPQAAPMLAWLSLGFYLCLALRLPAQSYRLEKFTGSDRFRYHWSWLRNRLLSVLLLGLLAIPYALATTFFNRQHTWPPLAATLGLLQALVLIRLAVPAFLEREKTQMLHRPRLSAPFPQAPLKAKGAWLKNEMKARKHYLDPALKMDKLAGLLALTPHELSRIINGAFKKNFSDWLNEFRVGEVIRQLQDPANECLTLLAIAYESGFNSKSTFHRIFREVTGQSPAEYKTALEKDDPGYNPGLHGPAAPLISASASRPIWQTAQLKQHFFMLKNDFKTAWRNMRYNKGFTALNVLGLATGMAVALLIGLWAIDQFSYDRFMPGYEQAYAVKVNYISATDGTYTQDNVPIPLADVLRNSVSGISKVAETDFADFPTRDFRVGDKKLLVEGGTVGNDFLQIFRYPLVEGNAAEVFKDPDAIVIDQSTAAALFGNSDALGKTIQVDGEHGVKVTGVMRDLPETSSFHFHFLIPYAYAEATNDWLKGARSQWDNNSFNIFISLAPKVSAQQVSAQIAGLIAEHNPAARDYHPQVFLYPIARWHLYNAFKNGKEAGGFIGYVRLFCLIGAIVLLIACINFVNLSTARSEKRAREVGIRKAIGSTRGRLIAQFLTESVLLAGFGFLLALVAVFLALPAFNTLAGTQLSVPYASPLFWGLMLGYVLLVGLIAGMRPAFYLSGFNPVKVLKGNILLGKAAVLPRQLLVVLQFSCSVALMISTVIIYQQIRYVKDRPTGYDADCLVSTPMTKDLAAHYDALCNDLLASGAVEEVTKASSPVTATSWHTGISQWPGRNPGAQKLHVGAVNTDEHYFRTLKMPLLSGHNFAADLRADSNHIIINEAAVSSMGLKDPVGQLISFDGMHGRAEIIGVVKDAVMGSPFAAVEPTVFLHGHNWNSQVIYRLRAGAPEQAAIRKIGQIFDRYNPAYPFDFSFVNALYDQQFRLENLVGKLAAVFAGLAIFVSCLGLFGLAAYLGEQRRKEIGVRKVLGASVARLWFLLSGNFIALVGISCLIASPVAFFALHSWLQGYDYRISIGPGVFLLSGAAAALIALATISFQAIRAALVNPVKSLRSE